ncbi:hypothetical protein QEZ52_00485 [Aliisedimentitalea scapharcae]|uniref:TolA protein n=1 Tax=Aliisedimentitalea scapharcae TaxID=1524259 RepID=A0ABZ2XWP1_9RHOB
MKDQAPESTELALPEPTALKELFGKPEGITGIIERIEKDVRSEVPDLTTKKGRDRVKSLAYKVSQSKTTLDGVGKELNDATRKSLEKVDEQRRDIRSRLDALRDEVRKPLEDWEAAEKKRVEGHKENLRTFDVSRVDPTMTSETIKAVIDEVSTVAIDESWEEFQEFAEASKAECLAAWKIHLTIAIDREEQAEKIARLEAEAAERDRKEAAERAEREAEEKKRHDKEMAERREREAAEAEERRQQEAREAEERRLEELEKAKAEAEERAKREADAEAKRKQEEHERELAEAKRREEQAAERERQRMAQEREEEERARAKREADKAHRARIQDEIAAALSPLPREAIPAALMDGRIPHVRILI